MLTDRLCEHCQRPLKPGKAGEFCAACLLERTLEEPAEESFAEPLGGSRSFGAYELVEEIARGGMGIVFKARQRALNRFVALKLITAGAFASSEALRRFRAEAQLAGQLHHPHIVPIIEVGEHDGHPYYTMALISGQDLGHQLGKAWPPQTAARLLTVIAEAVQFAHERGILHRDLKPTNILLDEQGQPHLTDFGLAKLVEEESSLTQANAILGTPGYMSPEQANGRPEDVTVAADVYGLGAILYQLLSGRPQFQGSTFLEVLQKVAAEAPKPPSAFNASIPPDLDAICLKCLEKRPGDRYGSARDLAEDLEAWLSGKQTKARPRGFVEQTWRLAIRHPVVSSLIVALFGTLAAGTVAVVIQWKRAEASAIRATAARNAAEQEQYYSSIAAAQKLLEEGSVRRARKLLLSAPEKYRHWEWGHLMFMAHQELFTIPADNRESNPPMVRFSHRSRKAAVFRNGVLQVWNLAERSIAYSLPGSNFVHHLFLPRNDHLLAINRNGEGSVWDEQGNKRFDLKPGAPIVQVETSGEWIATIDARGEILLWNGSTGEVQKKLGTAERSPTLRFSSDGTRLYEGVGTPRIRTWKIHGSSEPQVWNARTNEIITAISPSLTHCVVRQGDNWALRSMLQDTSNPLYSPRKIRAVEISPDGNRCLVFDESNQLSIWTPQAALVQQLNQQILFFQISADSRYVAVNSGDPFISVIHLATGQTVFKVAAEPNISPVSISPDSALIAMGKQDGEVKFWHLDSPRLLVRYGRGIPNDQNARFQKISFHPNGKEVAGAHRSKTATIWEVEHQKLKKTLAGHRQWVRDITYSPDGSQIATAGVDRDVLVWDSVTGTLIHRLQAHNGTVFNVAFHPHGKELISADAKGELIRWSLSTSSVLERKSPVQSAINALAYSPDGKYFAWAAESEVVLEYPELESFPWHRLRAHKVQALSFSSDGKLLAIATSGQGVLLFDLQRKEISRTLPSTSLPLGLSFSPDTKRLAVAQSHLLTSLGFPSVELWDVETGRSILQFDAPKGQLHSVQFSPNGKILAAGHSTGALILMRSYPWEWNVTQRSLSQHVATYSQVWQSRYLLEPCPSELFQFQAPHNAWQKWPARPAKATSAHIDLTRYYNAWLDVAWSPLNFKNEGETHFAELKPGMHKFGGVDFDLRGIVQLSGQANDWRQEFPLQVALPVHGLIAELHFLQGTYFWNPQGTQPGHYVVHYGNGEQQVIAIQVGKNVSPSWGALPGPWSSSNSVYKTAPLPRTFASPSSPAGTRGELCLISWTNPTPQLAVTSVTFHSTSAGSAPFLAALTIKEADAKPLQTH